MTSPATSTASPNPSISTITNIAAPTIVRDIGGGESLIKWLGAGYAPAMGVLLVVGGRLGDRYGKRRMFLVGIAGFTLASAMPRKTTSARLSRRRLASSSTPTFMPSLERRTVVTLFRPVPGTGLPGLIGAEG